MDLLGQLLDQAADWVAPTYRDNGDERNKRTNDKKWVKQASASCRAVGCTKTPNDDAKKPQTQTRTNQSWSRTARVWIAAAGCLCTSVGDGRNKFRTASLTALRRLVSTLTNLEDMTSELVFGCQIIFWLTHLSCFSLACTVLLQAAPTSSQNLQRVQGRNVSLHQ